MCALLRWSQDLPSRARRACRRPPGAYPLCAESVPLASDGFTIWLCPAGDPSGREIDGRHDQHEHLPRPTMTISTPRVVRPSLVPTTNTARLHRDMPNRLHPSVEATEPRWAALPDRLASDRRSHRPKAAGTHSTHYVLSAKRPKASLAFPLRPPCPR
jgi:hypothetical protein